MSRRDFSREWKEAQEFERGWWLNERQYHDAELVKSDYVARMLLVDRGVGNKSVLDVGCGPFSLLMRVPCNRGASAALDPLQYADLEGNYATAGVRRLVKKGEDLSPADGKWDEAWIYNCLQHVEDPTRILDNTLAVADVVRIFEWIHIPPYTGHLHELNVSMLEEPLRRHGWTPLFTSRGHLEHSGLHGDYYCAAWKRPTCPVTSL